MSRSKGPDDSLLLVAPKTNTLFIAMAITALLAFLGTLGLFTYTLVHNREISRQICTAANVNRAAITLLIKQGTEEQFVPGEIRTVQDPKKPGERIIFYVPANPNEERTKKALKIIAPIDCESQELGAL